MHLLQIFKTTNGELMELNDIPEKGVWINLIAPTEAELLEVSQRTGLELDFLRAALDDEERSRIESEEGQVLILINVPYINHEEVMLTYDTIPLGIVINHSYVVTVCLRSVPLFDELLKRKNAIHTAKRTRIVLQFMYHTATSYLRYLKQIDRHSTEIEAELQKSMKNEELVKLLHLEKSLVYFTTALRANEIVMEKLLRSQLVRVVDPHIEEANKVLNLYEEDEDLLEDVITENKQAIEMADIHSNILSGMMDAFASIISNNLNIVMKFLTSVTIVMALPTMVASFYGMNVSLPLQGSAYAFPIVLGFSLLITGIGIFVLAKRKMF